jgi:hypothetical protein
MRASTAVLADTSIRLWDLDFPRGHVLLARTRAPYVDLDSLIAFSKKDRDGKVDAYLAAYLPEEVVVLFFLGGDLANAARIPSVGREPLGIGEALRRIRAESERAEIAFHEAPPDLLAALFATCVQQPQDVNFAARTPEGVFKALYERRWTGMLELISDGCVNYLMVKEGRFASGHFAQRRPDEAPMVYVARLFTSTPPDPLPRVVAKLYDVPPPLPLQAPPAMIAMFRQYGWELAELIEREAPGEGAKRAERVRQRLMPQYEALCCVGSPRGVEAADPVVAPATLADGMAAWTRELLGEVEVLAPQSAPRLLKEAARPHRFALQAVRFFERLPWQVQW